MQRAAFLLVCLLLAQSPLVPPTAPVAAQETLPAAFVGMWEGTAVDANTGEEISVEVELSGGSVGADVGTYLYPPSDCGGGLSLQEVAADGSQATLTERFGFTSTKPDVAPCPTGTDATVTVSLQADGTLAYEWSDPASGRSRAATLVWQVDYGRFAGALAAVAGSPGLAGALSGTLVSECCQDTTAGAGVSVADFVATATFTTPTEPDANPGGVGFAFHRTPEMVERIIVHWGGGWNYWPQPEGNVRAGDIRTAWGAGLPFDDTPGGTNTVELVVAGDTALLGVNGLYVATIDLVHPVAAGDVEVVAGWTSGDVPGTMFDYTDFTVWVLPDVPPGGPAGPIGDRQARPDEGTVTPEPIVTITPVAPETPPTEATGELPAAFVGTWAGILVASDGEEFQIAIDLTGGGIRTVVGTIDVLTEGCSLELTLREVEAGGNGVELEMTAVLSGDCEAGGTFTLTFGGDSSLGFEVRSPDGQETLTGTLVRSGTTVDVPDDATAFAAALARRDAAAPLAGPFSGELALEAGASVTGEAVTVSEGFTASVTFSTPTQPAPAAWDIGFVFGAGADQQQIVLSSWGSWFYGVSAQGVVSTGAVPSFTPAPGATITLDLVVEDGAALLGVNGQFVTRLSLVQPLTSADVAVGAGFVSRTAGLVIAYSDFTVWSIAPREPCPCEELAATLAAQGLQIAALEARLAALEARLATTAEMPETPTPETSPSAVTTPQVPTRAETIPAATSEPRIVLQAASSQPRVGEEVLVRGESTGLGLPVFRVGVRAPGTAQSTELATITYDGRVERQPGGSPVVEVVDASGSAEGVELVLRAVAPGTIEVTLSATGEVQVDGVYQFIWVEAEPLRMEIGPAGPETPPAALPAAVLGSWEGSANDVTAGFDSEVTVELTGGTAESVVGTIDYPAVLDRVVPCGGNLALGEVSADGNQVELVEQLTYGTASCSYADATVTLTLQADDSLTYEWTHPNYAGSLTGTLVRSDGAPPTITVTPPPGQPVTPVPEPVTPVPVTVTPPPAAVGELPANFVGQWEGTATWDTATLPVSMELREGSVGDAVGTIEYALYGGAGPRCGGDVSLQTVAADGQQIELTGVISYDPQFCLVDATVAVTFVTDGAFAYDWRHPFLDVTGTGTLTQTTGGSLPEPPKVDQGTLPVHFAFRGGGAGYQDELARETAALPAAAATEPFSVTASRTLHGRTAAA